MVDRRGLLRLAVLALARPVGAAAARPLALAAAWDDGHGRHHVGVLGLDAAARAAPRELASLEVPTRAHAVLPCADGTLVAVARRPGAWMLRWRPGLPAARAVWRWSEPDRTFNGHVVEDAGARLLSTETDAADGRGLLVVRDAHTLAVVDEWPTGGVDPHMVLPLPAGGWLVANGGVPTLPETGRVKLDRSGMDSSLVRLDPTGRLDGRWRLAEPRLSLRHLARHADGVVGVALQSEQADEVARRTAPLLALWDGDTLRSAEAAPLEGYAGDIVATAQGFLVAATRADAVVAYGADGRVRARHTLAQACALAAAGGPGWLAAGAGSLALGASGAAPDGGLRIDNHWQPMPAGAAGRVSFRA